LKNKVKITKLKAPVYGTPIWIVVSNSFYSAIDKIEDIIDKKIADDNYIKGLHALTYIYYNHKGAPRIIFFFKPKSRPGLIAHESKHAVNSIFAYNGVRLSANNDESECYYLDWIVERCHGALKRFLKS